jgi:predicted nucleic acid-binding protein
LNLLRARGEFDRALLLGDELLAGHAVDLIFLTPVDVQKAFVIFSTHRDQPWSFVDCTSLAAMLRLGLNAAIALDHHFRQMPGIAVYP